MCVFFARVFLGGLPFICRLGLVSVPLVYIFQIALQLIDGYCQLHIVAGLGGCRLQK